MGNRFGTLTLKGLSSYQFSSYSNHLNEDQVMDCFRKKNKFGALVSNRGGSIYFEDNPIISIYERKIIIQLRNVIYEPVKARSGLIARFNSRDEDAAQIIQDDIRLILEEMIINPCIKESSRNDFSNRIKAEKILHQQSIEIISDTLCNVFDWDSGNPKHDFIESIKENNIQIPSEVAGKIFDDFVKLEPSVRSSPNFNYHEFILSRYVS